MALDAIKAGICASEGSSQPTSLTQAVLDHFKISDMQELIDIFYDPPLPRSEIAKFAPVFMDCVKNADQAATEILKYHAKKLADTVSALLVRMPEGTPLGLWGGVMINCTEFRDEFSSHIKQKFPATKIFIPEYAPEYGAVFAAMKSDGGTQ